MQDEIQPITWATDRLRLLDQTRLPQEEVVVESSDYRQVIASIREMRVRGAPAIGVTGAYAMVLAAKEILESGGAGGISVPPSGCCGRDQGGAAYGDQSCMGS